jgi:hypothetical protein
MTSPVVDLQPLFFKQQQSPGPEAVYQAQVRYSDAPDAPVFALTVTTASPADDKAKAELEKFLDEMRARFAVAAPGPDHGPVGQNPDPYDPGADILIEPSLVQPPPNQDGAGVEMVLQTSVGGHSKLEEVISELVTGLLGLLSRFAPQRFQSPYYSVGHGGSHIYKYLYKGDGSTTVKCDSGRIWACKYDPPGPRYPLIKDGVSPRFTARKIEVIGHQAGTYTISATFYPIS